MFKHFFQFCFFSVWHVFFTFHSLPFPPPLSHPQFSEKPLYIVMNFVGKMDLDKWWTTFQKDQKFHKDSAE